MKQIEWNKICGISLAGLIYWLLRVISASAAAAAQPFHSIDSHKSIPFQLVWPLRLICPSEDRPAINKLSFLIQQHFSNTIKDKLKAGLVSFLLINNERASQPTNKWMLNEFVWCCWRARGPLRGHNPQQTTFHPAPFINWFH